MRRKGATVKKTLFLIIILSLLIARCATDQTMTGSQESCEAPVWQVADFWRYQLEDKSGWMVQVAKVEKDLYIVDVPGDQYRHGFDPKTLQFKTFVDAQGKKIAPPAESALLYDFPLSVGKKWTKVIKVEPETGPPQVYYYMYKVVSFEKVTVPAGRFNAFKVERELYTQNNQKTPTTITHIWYAPEAKNVVKYKSMRPEGDRSGIPRESFELASYKLAG